MHSAVFCTMLQVSFTLLQHFEATVETSVCGMNYQFEALLLLIINYEHDIYTIMYHKL